MPDVFSHIDRAVDAARTVDSRSTRAGGARTVADQLAGALIVSAHMLDTYTPTGGGAP